jgi:hypothetical protein
MLNHHFYKVILNILDFIQKVIKSIKLNYIIKLNAFKFNKNISNTYTYHTNKNNFFKYIENFCFNYFAYMTL